jgi:amidophosphoribosyltransferase
VTAAQFINDKAFNELLASIDKRTTVLHGHTRWRTRGNEQMNHNNHPIRAGNILGTHNGTIYNADYLFRRYNLPRFAEVDSEILVRLADRAIRKALMNIERFKKQLRRSRGQITAVMGSRTEPGTVFVLKGNKPLEIPQNKRLRVVLYASGPLYLDKVVAGNPGWRELVVPPMNMIVFRHADLFRYSVEAFEFVAQERKRLKT